MSAIESASPIERLSPEILRIPPSPKPPYGPAKWTIIISLSFTALIVTGVELAQKNYAEIPPVLVAMLSTGAISAMVLIYLIRRYRKRRAEFMNRHASQCVELTESEIRNDIGYKAVGLPSYFMSGVRRRHPLPTDRARVICFGFVEIPEVGSLRFEPRFFTGWDLVARDWFSKSPFYLIVFVGMAINTSMMFHVNWLMGASIFAGFVLLLFALSIPSMASQYVRMAPGIIQFMSFGSKKGPPTIRSYRMDPGTQVTVVQRAWHVSFSISRDGQTDLLNLASVRNRRKTTLQVWESILSTAPIPDLPDNELLS